ncbi:MAG: LacI family DNA-binding transcriptional regulator [Nakamurella sp.]
MPGQVTLADVARAAGVSLATASRALNGSPGRTVRAELAAKVTVAAANLGYSVNAHAQAMARGATTTVGLVVHDIADPYAASIASGVMAAAAERDLIVSISSTASDPELELRHMRALLQQRARAVILAGSRFTDAEATTATHDIAAAIAAAGGRVAAIGQDLLGVRTVSIDNSGGARRLASTLCSLGYQRFAVLAGPEQLATCEERLAGFREGLAESGAELAPENILAAQFTRDGGYVAMRELLDQGLSADCIFAVNDIMAVGAMAALREQGYRVGRDVALAGFDGIPTLRDIEPALTTVRLPLVEIGRAALNLALADSDSEDAVAAVVRGDVAVRDSTPAVTPAVDSPPTPAAVTCDVLTADLHRALPHL